MTGRGLIEDLVDANHILADKGIFDAFGHVSARTGQDRFLLARNVAPGQVSAPDIVEYDLDSEAVTVGAPRPYLESFIHGEIYRARPDVHGIVHSHAHRSFRSVSPRRRDCNQSATFAVFLAGARRFLRSATMVAALATC